MEHLARTAQLAKEFASGFAPFEAEIAGYGHDIAKYGELFQRRLHGEASGIDHWSLGAWILLQHYKETGLAAALAIQGHHIGLQSGRNIDSLRPDVLAACHPLKLVLSEPDPSVLEKRYIADGGVFPSPPPGVSSRFLRDVQSQHNLAAMLDVRMLFSALVDADFIATEAHFNRSEDGTYKYRPPGRTLAVDQALARLDSHLAEIRAKSKADPAVRALREDLQRTCMEAADRPPGLYTLTAPTGSGKTIAMLIFALRHALRHGLRRIIVVLPFLSIIEQTAAVYRSIFGEDDLHPYVLEDHSLAEVETCAKGPDESRARLLAEDWDAPVIITTSVRFCESLFANRPSACRKLHNIAGSVVLWDEVQTLPAHLAVPTLAALSHLKEAFGCSVVLSTATQPAFGSLSAHVSRHAPAGWEAQEIVPPELGLFRRVQRVRVHWPGEGLRTTTLEEVAEKMAHCPQALAIVNVKRHSRKLYKLLAERVEKKGLYHLSTDMCPAHRTDVLSEVRSRLEAGLECRLVSTQCVEAGVDIDFPVVFRAWGPLEALAQAAGRCNREGHLAEGEFHVFLPPIDQEAYPDQTYSAAASEVRKLALERGGTLDLQDPALFLDYYREFYDLANVVNEDKGLFEFIKTCNFAEVAERYHLIDNPTINVLVPYGRRIDEYRELRQIGLNQGLSRDWVHRARRLAVSLYRSAEGRSTGDDWLEPVKYRGDETGWYVYLDDRDYSEELGLIIPDVPRVLGA
jgi:CRISPR-associated helicase Cas3/CRISPR-associated endonuclease Cas3-HD